MSMYEHDMNAMRDLCIKTITEALAGAKAELKAEVVKVRCDGLKKAFLIDYCLARALSKIRHYRKLALECLHPYRVSQEGHLQECCHDWENQGWKHRHHLRLSVGRGSAGSMPLPIFDLSICKLSESRLSVC